MKAFLALGVRKSVSEELTFIKLAFSKSDFLDLVDFGFLDLAKFAIVDRFLILLPTLPLFALVVLLNTSWFFLFSVV